MQAVPCHFTLGKGCTTCQISRLCQARACFMIAEGKTHRNVFQMRSMGIYRRFFFQQSAMMPFSASRGCQWRFRVGRDDVGDVCCQLKNLILRWMEGYKSPTTTSRGHIRFSCDSPSAHATHCGKIGTKMLCHSLGFSPHA